VSVNALAGWLGGAIGGRWLRRRRNRHRASARPLRPDEHAALAPCFDPDLLAMTRVAEVAAIDPPFPRALLRGPLRELDLRWAAGIAFIDTVVLVRPPRNRSTLFHELVHIQQYQMLGTRRFASLYFRGWLENGREYMSIPLEVDAYELSDEFAAGRAPRVRPELDRRFRARGWT
jgi:hypothetical protein